MRRRARAGVLLSLSVLLGLGCGRARGPSEAELPAPEVVHAAPAYTGTWIGPELSLSFAGPWVLVWPSADPHAAPVEMRVLVERQQGSAYALRTTLAGVFEADFLRPSDWTLLVEDGQLAIAMGDEPLTAYLAALPGEGPASPLLGPAMLEGDALPEHVLRDDALACLEVAADACAALEATGPRALGCRELHWGACIEARQPAAVDPTQRAAAEVERDLRLHARVLEYSLGLRRASAAGAFEQAHALYERALEQAAARLTELDDADMLPDTDARAPIERALAAAAAREPAS